MKKRNKKNIIFSVCLLLIALLLIVGFYLYSQNEINKIKEEVMEIKKQELINEYEAKDQYIGISSCFLGTVSNNGKWNSANEYIDNIEDAFFKLGESIKVNVNKKDFTVDDIIQNKEIYLYDENKFLGKKDDIFYDKDLNPEYYNDINYFRFNSDKYYEYKNNEEETSKDKMYDNFLDFQVGKALESKYSDRITNIEKEKYLEYEKYVKEVLDNRGLKIDIVINKILLADSDNNGENEIYILSNSQHKNVNDEFKDGRYSLVLKIENGKTEIIMERVLTPKEMSDMEYMMKYYEISGMTLIDFNNDGKLELVIYACVWDLPEIYVIRLNDANEKELCLYGNFAW